MRRLAAGILALFLMLRLLPAFSIFWAEHISLPLLDQLACMGGRLPFVALELLFFMLIFLLLASLLLRRFMRSLLCMLLCASAICLTLWYPLYFLPQPAYAADEAQLSILCEGLIDELNSSELHFTIPDELPAKFVRFPQWMNLLNLNGLCSFATGETLISPEIPAAALPFVAVHERMHLEGHAGEGSANIAAWKSSMERGGAYADSARLWALRYAMGILRRNQSPHYDENLLRMNHATLQRYREAGGAYSPARLSPILRSAYRALGIEERMQDYEILAPYLAGQLQE